MKRLFPLLFALAACPSKNQAPDASVSDAASSAIVFDASSEKPAKYRYWNQNDSLERFMVVVPMTFQKHESRVCNVTECLADLTFTGDGITIHAFAPPAARERHSIEEDKKAATTNKETITSESLIDGGWTFATSSADGQTYTTYRQVSSFVSPIRVEITGPMSQKTSIEEVSDRLGRELLISHNMPKHYCTPLPWTPPLARTQQLQVWHGTLSAAPPWVLTLDFPACGSVGRAVWELEVSSKGKADLKALAGKHIRAEGYFDAANGPPHYRPIVSPLDLATSEPADAALP